MPDHFTEQNLGKMIKWKWWSRVCDFDYEPHETLSEVSSNDSLSTELIFLILDDIVHKVIILNFNYATLVYE